MRTVVVAGLLAVAFSAGAKTVKVSDFGYDAVWAGEGLALTIHEIGSPLVDEAEIRIGAPFEAAVFRIVTHNQSDTHRRVASVRLNGVELKDRRLAHADIVRGGLLEFDMH